MYLIYYGKGGILATTLEVALGFFEGVHGRPMRASSLPGGYVYEVFSDFPGAGWSRAERAIADLSKQRPEEMPRLPVFPFVVEDGWGDDEWGNEDWEV
jgi:hypothetical protein